MSKLAPCDHAVVFVSGIIGVGELKRVLPFVDYFRGVRAALQNLPVPILFADMPTGKRVEDRAEALAAMIATSDATCDARTGVRYESYACVRPPAELPIWFRGLGRKLQAACGDSDGQVCRASASWGDFLGDLRSEHIEVTGWNLGLPSPRIARPFDHRQFYRELVLRITAEWQARP